MNSATDFGCIFIALDVAALSFAQILNMPERQDASRPWETDLIVISAEEATGLAGFVYFRSCFENFHTRRSCNTV